MPEEIIARDYANDGGFLARALLAGFTTELVDHYRSVAEYAFERGLVRNKVDVDKLLDDASWRQALRDAEAGGLLEPGTAPAPAQAHAARLKAS
jgi:sulfonate transport system substrate-binding protein